MTLVRTVIMAKLFDVKTIFFGVLMLVGALLHAQPIDIVLWHVMAGHLGTELTQLTDDFNSRQQEYRIKPVYKGDYTEVLTSFAAAFRAQHPPALVQIAEVGTATMLSPRGIIKPVDEIMQEHGLSVPVQDFFPAVRRYYSRDNRLMAMPFNISVPILYYNADKLAEFGVAADSLPRTWDSLEHLAKRLQQAGLPCVYTSAYPAWILVESFLASHGLAARSADGMRVFTPPLLLAHFTRLERWQRLHWFEYGGRDDDPTVLFTSGHCQFFSHSSGVYQSLVATAPFHVGIMPLPRNSLLSAQYSNVVGGAALWAVAGQEPSVYAGIAQFFAYLSEPQVQARWHQRTGYLPLGVQGQYKALAHAVVGDSTLAMAIIELAHVGDVVEADNNRQSSLKNAQMQIRRIYDEALEAMFAGMKSPADALADAALLANTALIRFMQNTVGSDS